MALYWGGTKGGSQQVSCGNVTTGDTADMSLVAWVRLPNNFTGAASVIDRRGGSATLHRFWILCVGDGAGNADFRFIRKHTTTDAVAISTQAYSTDDSTWYFVAGTHVAGAAPKLYVGEQNVDLAEVSYSSQTAPVGTLRTGSQPLSLGRQPTNTSTGFGGAIAVVGLFDTALSAGDLRAMRIGGLRTILSRTDLTHCWVPSLNGVSGTVYDIGARSILNATNVDGTISGTLTQIENPGLLRGFPAVGPADWRPVASTAVDTNVSASPANLRITGQQASVAHDIGVSAAAAPLQIDTHAATIGTTTNVNVDATPAALQLSPNPAIVSLDVAISAAFAPLQITGHPASIAYGANVNTAPASLQITGNAAAIGFDVGVLANVAGLRFSTYAASVSDGGLSERRSAYPGASATGGTFTRSGTGGLITRNVKSGSII